MDGGMRQTVLVWVLFTAVCSCLKIDPLVYDEQLLWVSGSQGEVNTYRIPLITKTVNGSLLAFAEGRKGSSSDSGAKFVAMRRSTDKGATWSPTKFIVNDGTMPDGLNLGSVVVDEEVGSVILIYAVCFHLHQCYPASTMMLESKDDGLSWSAPRNLSLQLGNRRFCPGPGYGIQKRLDPAKGRLIVCGHSTLEANGVFCILSDDHGRTWYFNDPLKSIPYNHKKSAQDFDPDECQPVEMLNGSVVINVRNQNGYHCRCRIIVRSDDGCQTLPVENLYFDSNLVDSAVAAGALLKDGVLFFTNPSDAKSRINLTLRWSLTSGDTWEKQAFQIWAGPSGYSCLTSLDSDSVEDKKYIYVIYEKGHKDYFETVSFVKIHLYNGKQ
ncbi:sialidase-1 [Gouania willdenowi]|uniref:Sialidase-1 n=1 Tax=Gouania willdenowi TaxID=441366 RepID=A0A8C5GDJ7_GOUWI|nr:sialidase-1 [Gouania willdenowi]